MARRKKQLAPTPRKNLRQATLFGLFEEPSSPSRPNSSSTSPLKVSPSKGGKRTRTKHNSRRASPPRRPDAHPSDAEACSDSSAVGAIRFEAEVIELSDEEVALPSTSRKAKVLVVESDEEGADTHLRRLQKRKAVRADTASDSESEPAPRRRKLLKGTRPAVHDSEDNLSDDIDQNQIIETRLRTRGRKTAFQKNLDKLKRKKRGEAPVSSSSESAEEYDGEVEESTAPFAGARPDNSARDDEESDVANEDDFIVEDDATAPIAELPMQFSMNTHQDLMHHFKIIFQFFVHIAVQPPHERRAFMKARMKEVEYFAVPLQVTRRKLSGLRDSLVASSVWRPDFKGPLEKYPELEVAELSFAQPQCDACHLGGRMSTRVGRLSGVPYDKLGFEPLQDGADSEENEDNKTAVEFYLGRFCAKRTRVFHNFTHWEYSLFISIAREIDELRGSKHGSKFVRIAYPGGRKPPEDLTDADGVVDWLDERRVVEMEWQKVKDMMESARHLEVKSKNMEDSE